jgi:exodeoxyribonuclease VII small subunit
MEKKKSYEEAYDELQEIVSEIESGQIGIDKLSDKVKRAGELIRFCKEKLFKTEKEVNDLLKEMEE